MSASAVTRLRPRRRVQRGVGPYRTDPRGPSSHRRIGAMRLSPHWHPTSQRSALLRSAIRPQGADRMSPNDSSHTLSPRRRVGVLLLNLGTPDATDYWSMRRYLKEFLSDRRVIEVPRWKWWPILNLIILTVRPGRKGKDYATIWNNERNEGPLKTITRSQAEKLSARLGMEDRVEVDWAMR